MDTLCGRLLLFTPRPTQHPLSTSMSFAMSFAIRYMPRLPFREARPDVMPPALEPHTAHVAKWLRGLGS